MTAFGALLPVLIVAGGALLVLLLEAFHAKENRSYLAVVSCAVLIAAGAVCVGRWDKGLSVFQGMLVLDNLALFIIGLLILAVALVILSGLKYHVRVEANVGEFYGLILLALAGLMIMVATTHLLVVVLGLEVASIAGYALAGLNRNDERSTEAAVKYFLLGSFATAFLIFGLALVFGSWRTLDIPAVTAALSSSGGISLGLVGFGLVLIGLGFKIALVPFHMWTPDVYQGAPTPVTSFFVIGPKAAAFAVLFRILVPIQADVLRGTKVFPIFYAIAALTILVGTLTALRQTNVKRLFAYSSIANAGYMLLAVLARDATSLVFFFAVYLFMSIGAFGCLIALTARGRETNDLADLAGIGTAYPWVAGLFAVFLISLAGFPPTGGFLAKFFVFSAAVRQGLTPLVIVGVVASLVSTFYYLRIIVTMFMRQPERALDVEKENAPLYIVLFICLYGILQLGLFPGPLLGLLRRSLLTF